MAIAKKCDRCGLYYDPYNCENDAEKINAIKLIPACSNEFMKWFKKENNHA